MILHSKCLGKPCLTMGLLVSKVCEFLYGGLCHLGSVLYLDH